MDEKKFAVMLTDTQEIKTLECDPQEELFEIARGTIGCEWIELVEAEPLAKDGYLMLRDPDRLFRFDRRGRQAQKRPSFNQLPCQ